MMEREQTSALVQNELENYSASLRRRTCAFKIALMDLMIIAIGLSICGAYMGARTTYKPSELEKSVDNKKVFETKVASGIMWFMGFSTAAIFGTLHFICARELLCRAIKADAKKILNVLALCKSTSMGMIFLGFVGVLLGYPDMKVCFLLILFDGISLAMFLSISMIESGYEMDVFVNIGKRILEQKMQKSQRIVSREMESV